MLLEFYGKECLHCKTMESLVQKLISETSTPIKQYEVWHNPENMKTMAEYDKNFCGGVPFFFNTTTKKFICGSASYEDLKQWSKEK